MAENELLAAYRSVPVVTRTMLTATILISVGVALKFIPFGLVYLDWSLIVYKFQIHRLFTSCFISGLNFNMLFDLYFMYTYGSQLETTTFAGRTADYAWFVIFTSLVTAAVSSYMNIIILFQSVLIAVIYLWSRSNSERIVSFMFGFQFKAVYFPWVLIAYTFVLSGAAIPWGMLIGVASAHLYYFLDHVYPAMGGPRLIPTPSLLYRFLPPQEVAGARFTGSGATANVYRPPAAAAAGGGAGASGHRWGQGNRLG
ncbi:Der1-like family-domain-containing protein [Gamsiella multidivaricata]|uniref:Der1-like family-domain-containing protein n=1 Tax=Gamsiella multidivaricata TaxID=101098 RepID=UPI00222053DB|nr:Der1-like family-domain-containing protein [Gamsiella multidivaricata]KAI7825744.1 Der1-like family-domain-containing protein [Gamsiella multidivaricata]